MRSPFSPTDLLSFLGIFFFSFNFSDHATIRSAVPVFLRVFHLFFFNSFIFSPFTFPLFSLPLRLFSSSSLSRCRSRLPSPARAGPAPPRPNPGGRFPPGNKWRAGGGQWAAPWRGAGARRARQPRAACAPRGTMAGAGRCVRACGLALAGLLLCCAARRHPAGKPGAAGPSGRRVRCGSGGSLSAPTGAWAGQGAAWRAFRPGGSFGRCARWQSPTAWKQPGKLTRRSEEGREKSRTSLSDSALGLERRESRRRPRLPRSRCPRGRAAASGLTARGQAVPEPRQFAAARSAVAVIRRCVRSETEKGARLSRKEAGGKVSRWVNSCKAQPVAYSELLGNKLSSSLSCTSRIFLYPMIATGSGW